MRASWQIKARGGAPGSSSAWAASARRSETGSSGSSRRKPQSLRHAGCQPHAGEATGTAPEGDRIELPQRNIRLGQQLLDHRQDQLAVAAVAAALRAH